MDKFNNFMYWLTSMLFFLLLFLLFGLFYLLPMMVALAFWNNSQQNLPTSYFMRDYVNPYYQIRRIFNQSQDRNLLLFVSLPMIFTPMAILVFPIALSWLGWFGNQASLLRHKKQSQNPLIILAEKYPQTFMDIQKEKPDEIKSLDDWFSNQIPQSLKQFESQYTQSDIDWWKQGIDTIREKSGHYLVEIWDKHHHDGSALNDLLKQLEIFNQESQILLNSFEQSYQTRNLT